MNGCPALPSAAAVGARKKAPMIAPPNQTMAEPTWTTLKKISHQSIRDRPALHIDCSLTLE